MEGARGQADPRLLQLSDSMELKTPSAFMDIITHTFHHSITSFQTCSYKQACFKELESLQNFYEFTAIAIA